MNSINLTGTIVREDPVVLTSANGKEYCRFTLQVRRKYIDKYDFVDCVAYKYTANNICKFFKKGDYISVLGELHIDKFEKGETTRYYTSVSVEAFSFCSYKEGLKSDHNKEDEDNKSNKDIKEEIGIDYDFDDDDLPF